MRTAGGQLAIEVSRRRRRRSARRGAARGWPGSRTGSARSAASCGSSRRPAWGRRLSATIPLDQPEPPEALAEAARTAESGGLRRRVLQSHAVVYALVMSLLVFIWLTTGGGYFWPQWAIAGWGLLLALHAWFARARPVGMLAGQTHPDR